MEPAGIQTVSHSHKSQTEAEGSGYIVAKANSSGEHRVIAGEQFAALLTSSHVVAAAEFAAFMVNQKRFAAEGGDLFASPRASGTTGRMGWPDGG